MPWKRFTQAILPGAGSAVGSSLVTGLLGGAFGGKNNAPPSSAYRDSTYGDIWGKMRAAEDFGIHPLYTLGNPGVSPVSGSGKQEPDFSALVRDAYKRVPKRQSKSGGPLMAAQIKSLEASAARDYAAAQEHASVAARTLQESNVRPQAIAEANTGLQPERMHSKVRLEDDTLVNNPDLAMDVSEIAGYYLNRFLNWQPNWGDFNEVAFGAWKRLGDRRYQELRRALDKKGTKIPARPKGVRRGRNKTIRRY